MSINCSDCGLPFSDEDMLALHQMKQVGCLVERNRKQAEQIADLWRFIDGLDFSRGQGLGPVRPDFSRQAESRDALRKRWNR